MGQARDFARSGLASGTAQAAVFIGIDHGWSMLPLTVDDLLPLEEYASRRKEFFDSHRRYVDRYRRVRIGPRLTLIFENVKRSGIASTK